MQQKHRYRSLYGSQWQAISSPRLGYPQRCRRRVQTPDLPRPINIPYEFTVNHPISAVVSVIPYLLRGQFTVLSSLQTVYSFLERLGSVERCYILFSYSLERCSTHCLVFNLLTGYVCLHNLSLYYTVLQCCYYYDCLLTCLFLAFFLKKKHLRSRE